MPLRATKPKKSRTAKTSIADFAYLSKPQKEEQVRSSVAAATADNRALGLPTYHGDEKGAFRLHPDGRKEYV